MNNLNTKLSNKDKVCDCCFTDVKKGHKHCEINTMMNIKFVLCEHCATGMVNEIKNNWNV